MQKNKAYRVRGDKPAGPTLELVRTVADDLVVSMRGAAGVTLARLTLGPDTGQYYEREILMRLADCTEIGEPPKPCAACGQRGGCNGWHNIGDEDGGGV